MQTTLNRVPQTVQERSVDATRHLRETLGLDDLKLLATALAEVAVAESAQRPEFANRIKSVYAELQALKATPRRSSKAAKPSTKLVPIVAIDDVRIDPHAPLDPYFLKRLYGDSQLVAALDGYSLAKLKEAAAIVEQKHVGTKPKSKARKADIINYIVEHVAGAGN